jgi:hypothetical protein
MGILLVALGFLTSPPRSPVQYQNTRTPRAENTVVPTVYFLACQLSLRGQSDPII